MKIFYYAVLALIYLLVWKFGKKAGWKAHEHDEAMRKAYPLPEHVNCRCDTINLKEIRMDLRKDVEAELKRNKKVLKARVNRPSGLHGSVIIKARILFAESVLDNSSGDAELLAALSKLRRTDGEV